MNKAQLEAMLKTHCGKSPEFCTDKELYTGLLSLVQTLARKGESGKGKKSSTTFPQNFLSESFYPTT